MAISIGVSASAAGTATSITTGAVTTTTGSCLLLFMNWSSATFTSVTDSKSNSWTQVSTELNASSHKTRCYVCYNATGGASHTFTLTLAASNDLNLFMVEIPGAATSSGVDQAGRTSDSSSPFTTTGLTTTQANEALVTFISGNSSSNPATHAETGLGSSTIQQNITNGALYWVGALATKLVSATGTYTPSWTENGSSNAHVWLVTVKEAAAGGFIVNPFNGIIARPL